ncbi:hypothetical protein QQ045_023636 [Rhodiola kirilowii]
MVVTTRSRSRGHSHRIFPDDSEEEKRSLTKGKRIQKGNKKYRNNRDRLLNKLKPGDHIAAKRMAWYYEHHGIYEGEEKGYPSVIHFQGPTRFSRNCLDLIYHLGSTNADMSILRRER